MITFSGFGSETWKFQVFCQAPQSFDSQGNSGSTDSTEPVEPTEPAGSTEPVEPTKPAGSTEPVEPAEPTDPADPIEQGDPGESGDSIGPVPSLKLEWLADGAAGEVTLSARLENASQDTGARVTIRLDHEEYMALSQLPESLLGEDLGEKGANLSFALDADNPGLEVLLAFSGAGVLVEVAEEDITVLFSGQRAEEAQWTLTATPLTFEAEEEDCLWSLDAQGNGDQEWNPEAPADLTFDLQAVPEAGAAVSQTLEVVLTLPEPFVFAQGEAAWDDRTGGITLGGEAAVLLEGLEPGSRVADISREDSALRFTLEREDPQGGLGALKLRLTILGTALQVRQRPMLLRSAPGSGAGTANGGGRAAGGPVSLQATLTSVNSRGKTDLFSGQTALQLTAVQSVKVTDFREGFEQNIFWVDNNNEEKKRPSTATYLDPVLSYRLTLKDAQPGENYIDLTEATLGDLGLASMPRVNITTLPAGGWTYDIGDTALPSAITVTDIYGDSFEYLVDWLITPRENDGYYLVDVTREDIENGTYLAAEVPGWYYVQARTLIFHVVVRQGTAELGDGVMDNIVDNMQFTVTWPGEKSPMVVPVADMRDYTQGIPDTPMTHDMTVTGLWKYNLDGSLITYTLSQIPQADGTVTGTIPLEEMNGDYLTITYDNTAVPNFSSETTALYSGGTLYLTLTGETEYEATKVWLDDGAPETVENRPTGEFHLWRYRKGEPYTTAAQLRNPDGTFVALELDTRHPAQTITFGIDFNGDGQIEDNKLPKYDSEGYEYIYVAREYLDSSGYEQVFGEVNPDGTVTDTMDLNGQVIQVEGPRTASNTYVYNGGILSNRIYDTATTQVTKVWDASAFQAEFDDVSVQVKLQSRRKGTDDPWVDAAGYSPVTMENFYSEMLTQTASLSVRQYDAYGRELEYRWVESGVTQEGWEDTNFTPAQDGSGSATFTLWQSQREIRYRSVTQEQPDGSTLITNTIANTLDYDAEKIWLDAAGQPTTAPEDASVNLLIYRTFSGEELQDPPIARIPLDGVPEDEPTLWDAELGIYVQETEAWKGTVTGLPEYDAQGRQYEYFLLEEGDGTIYFPIYETHRTEDNGYFTAVYNPITGGGYRIMVRKNWVDDSDVLHREPVTIQAYLRADNTPIDGATITLEDGVWYGVIGIGAHRPEEVYILETYVGSHRVPLQSYFMGSGEPSYEPLAPDEYAGEDDHDYTAIQYEATYHRYEVTYSQEEVAETNFFTVSNRRLGNVNLTATKKWVDGDGQIRRQLEDTLKELGEDAPVLALRLEFSEEKNYYNITREGILQPDFVTVGSMDSRVPIQDNMGRAVSSEQAVSLTGTETKYYFWNLPKYDRNGQVVHYTVREIWLNPDGDLLSPAELRDDYPQVYEILEPYSCTITQDGYTVTDDSLHARDVQEMTVTNRLSDTKWVRWHKEWNDRYNYAAGLRPDIYLDIYQVTHISETETQLELFQADYRWTYVDDETPDPAVSCSADPVNHWHAVLTDLPKYDELGYEIRYYAVEHTHVNAGEFDYLAPSYSYPVNGTEQDPVPMGNRNGMEEQYIQQGYGVEIPEEGVCALLEEGTFTNNLTGHVSIQGQKLWQTMPAAFPDADLPQVTFKLYQSLADDPESEPEEIASLTISDWQGLYADGGYNFLLAYTGENTLKMEGGEAGLRPCRGRDAPPQVQRSGRAVCIHPGGS